MTVSRLDRMRGEYRYRPAWWLPGGHTQTLWGKLARRARAPALITERIATPDGDQVEVHSAGPRNATRHLLLLHGLAGTIRSHYVRGILSESARLGYHATLMLFRGCGDAPNVARRFYHSGETTDVDHVFTVLRQRAPHATWFAAGVSLGGNVLLKWLGEQGTGSVIRATAAVSVPFDLEAGARAIERGFARIYDRHFLRSLRRKALEKLERFPDLCDRERLLRARSVFEFDEAVTAPVHGFESAHDYYSRSSSLGFLERIRVPTLLLSAADDPFLENWVLPRVEALARGNPALHTEFHPRGGHVGFVGGIAPWRASYYAERRLFDFFDAVEAGAPRS